MLVCHTYSDYSPTSAAPEICQVLDKAGALPGGPREKSQEGGSSVIPSVSYSREFQSSGYHAPLGGCCSMKFPVWDKMPTLNSSSDFLLLQFSEVREWQLIHFFVFLALYLAGMSGNLLIVTAVILDHHLHTPMYFFLMNLALMDLGSISVTVPKSMVNSLLNSIAISYSECVAQVFFFVFFEGTGLAILTIMAHDRYVAICKPLQYETIMNKGACIQMATGASICGVLYGVVHISGTFSITFCSNVVDQFFCEIPKLLKLSCSDLYLVEVGLLVLSSGVGFGCFIFIITTYVWIFNALLRIPSEKGRQKALSTCLPHLIVVSVLMFTGIFVYAKPPGKISSDLDLGFAVIYAIFPPMLNPFIYSMRNKELQTALWRLLNHSLFYKDSVFKLNTDFFFNAICSTID
ncbi:olfactory receptor 14C36-like [Tiliqua scincoides]|uniref:olfactory receptor 14C36-like n=1 Tax=Tiliqua scincoides TaxID=71010 RepID=UPI003461871D